MARTLTLLPRLIYCAVALLVSLHFYAAPAAAKTVVLEPCGSDSNFGFGTFGDPGLFSQWLLEARCPSELTLLPKPGATLSRSGGTWVYPLESVDSGSFTKVSFDFLGGNGSDTGLKQGVKVCDANGGCGPLVMPASADVTLAEHHELTADNGQIPPGGAYLHIVGACPGHPANPCEPSRPLVIKNLKITIEDTIEPTIEISTVDPSLNPYLDPDVPRYAPIREGEWNTGMREFRISAADQGVGVKYAEFEMYHHTATIGARWFVSSVGCGGGSFLTQTIPFLCPSESELFHQTNLNQAGQQWGMNQGLNRAQSIAYDAAGNATQPLRFDFKLDSVRPALSNLQITPETTSRWQPSTRIGLRWTNVGENEENDTQSGVVRAHYRVTSDDSYSNVAWVGDESGDAIDTLPALDLPGPGRWHVELSTFDRAGNESIVAHEHVSVDPVVPAAPALAALPLLSAQHLLDGASVSWSPPANVAGVRSGICGYALLVDQNPTSDPGNLAGIAGSQLSAPLPKHLPNGTNFAHLRAISCAGVAGPIAHLAFEVDSQVPDILVSPAGPGGWYSEDHPLVASIDGPPESGIELSAAIDGEADAWVETGSLPVVLPDGTHLVTLKARDAAGNEAMRLVSVKRDGSKPTAKFLPRDPARPTRIRALVTDGLSGVRDAYMQYRKTGSDEWHALGDIARPPSGASASIELNARFPDVGLADGVYDLRVTASDLAGHSERKDTFDDGAPSVVSLPLRSASTVTAGFAVATAKAKRCKGKSTRRKCRAAPAKDSATQLSDSVLVAYGKTRKITGTLRSGSGAAIEGGTLQVYSSAVGRAPKLERELISDVNGAFSFAPAAGTSRTFTVRFTGSETDAPDEATAKLLTKSKVTLRMRRKRVARGIQLSLSGYVTADGATIPKSGKSVRLQYLARGEWNDLPGTETDLDGNFAFRPRTFKVKKQAVRYKFRAVVPWSEGWAYETGTSPALEIVVR